MYIKQFWGITALMLACHAGAATTSWGTHDPLETAVGTVSTGSFVDTLNFTLTDATPLMATTVANNLGDVLGIKEGRVSLFAHVDESNNTLINAFDFTGSTGDTPRMFQTLGPGRYFYQITGTATGSHGGLYTLSSAPVPEVSVWALSLCAALLVGGIYRRRL